MEFEEIILLPPAVALPLDITKFVSGWTQGVPQSLMEFYTLSRRLRQQLDRLPARGAEVPADWIPQSTEWSQEVVKILRDMHRITVKLLAARPVDLRGNFHPVEEYESDIGSTIDEFERILRHVKAEDTAQIVRALERVRKIYMFFQIMKR